MAVWIGYSGFWSVCWMGVGEQMWTQLSVGSGETQGIMDQATPIWASVEASRAWVQGGKRPGGKGATGPAGK